MGVGYGFGTTMKGSTRGAENHHAILNVALPHLHFAFCFLHAQGGGDSLFKRQGSGAHSTHVGKILLSPSSRLCAVVKTTELLVEKQHILIFL